MTDEQQIIEDHARVDDGGGETGWRPIATAPSQEEVVVCCAGMLGWWCIAWRTALGEWCVHTGFDRVQYTPTHWMPLPPPPSTAAPDGETGA